MMHAQMLELRAALQDDDSPDKPVTDGVGSVPTPIRLRSTPTDFPETRSRCG
jgi:hypothetical protein